CIALPLSIYAGELRSNNTFVNYVAKELAEKLTQRVINGAITTLQPLEARLCAYITQTSEDGLFRETLTEVAGVVGASYRHLLRCLDNLCRKGILQKELSGYRVINRKALDKNAGDLYVLK
ncbi:MAG: Crp/Fnr family transcriptional regulator, partial [Defluviitaleaceae bacterium]|nr:Crp/Fnr family transcriptional regulator [Defluviitaleaceae bacterium]